MHTKRKRRLFLVVFILFGASIAVALTLYALQQNINLYYTPSQIIANKAPVGHVFRIGGMVKKGSLKRKEKGLKVTFILTDMTNNVKIVYDGILPDLFREGQGIVAQGKLDPRGIFIADQVLAKHGADYMPPVKKSPSE